jgi:hypothetical protein
VLARIHGIPTMMRVCQEYSLVSDLSGDKKLGGRVRHKKPWR